MRENWGKRLIRYAVAILAGLLLGLLYLWDKQLLEQPLVDQYRLLSDAAMLPGVLMLFSGLMIFLSNEGSFDGVSFVLGKAVRFLLPFMGLQKGETYGEYVQRKREKQIRGYGFLFFCGIGFLAVSILFVLLYNQIHG